MHLITERIKSGILSMRKVRPKTLLDVKWQQQKSSCLTKLENIKKQLHFIFYCLH